LPCSAGSGLRTSVPDAPNQDFHDVSARMSWNMAVPGVASAALRARLVVMTDSRTTSMPRRAARHFTVFLLLLAACLSALPVTAQSPLLSAVQPAADSSS